MGEVLPSQSVVLMASSSLNVKLFKKCPLTFNLTLYLYFYLLVASSVLSSPASTRQPPIIRPPSPTNSMASFDTISIFGDDTQSILHAPLGATNISHRIDEQDPNKLVDLQSMGGNFGKSYVSLPSCYPILLWAP